MTIAVVRVRFPSRAQLQMLDNQASEMQNEVTSISATQKATYETDPFVSNYLPRYVVANPEIKDQRVYIKYKVWNYDKGKFV